jgi:hypothetical protein
MNINPPDGQDLGAYLKGRQDLTDLSKTLYREFFIYTVAREELDAVEKRQQRLKGLRAWIDDRKESLGPVAMVIAAIVAGISAGRIVQAYVSSRSNPPQQPTGSARG